MNCRTIGAFFALTVVSSIPLVGLTLPQIAFAQETEVLEEILVSARRREENLFDIPQSITVMSSEKIEQQQITTLPDIATLYPNIGYTHDLSPTSTFVSVRGIGSTRNTDPAVAIVIDGVQASNASVTRQELFDIERIEILKGPQGSLYGRNASGGVFNISTKGPSDEHTGKMQFGFGSADSVDIRSSIAGPISDDVLFYRAAVSYHNDEGTIYNPALDLLVDPSINKTARVRLDWHPNDRFSADFRANIDDMEVGTYYHAVTRPIGEPHRGVNANSNGSAYDAPNLSNPVSVAFGDIKDLSLKLDIDVGELTLTSITAANQTYERYGRISEGRGRGERGEGPGDFGWLNAVNPPNVADVGNEQTYDVESISQELRLLSPDDGANIRWDVGAYYISVDRDDSLPVYIDFDADGLLQDETVVINPLGTARNIDAYAFFGNVDWDLSDTVTLNVGLRYDNEDRDQLDLDDPTPAAFQDASFDDVQPRVSLSYQPRDGRMYYATVSRGFRSGGFNTPRSDFPDVYDKEILSAFEVGHKGQYMGGQVQLNVAAFFNDIEDKQNFVFDSRAVAQITYNIPESEVLGVEADVSYVVNDNWSLGFAAGWMDSEINEFQFAEFFPINIPASQGGLGDQIAIDFAPVLGTGVVGGVTNADVVGNKLDLFSHWSTTLTADFEYPIGNSNWSFLGHVDYAYRGDNYWEVFNTDVENDVSLLNGNLTIANDVWTVSLWGTNLTDEDYWSSFQTGATQGLPDIGYKAPERRYGVNLAYAF